ncbi:MAG TPA: hypothetical protein VN676_01180 [Steroidobacteraceae bacterium]|nr:hypothetical protein [Steroidobacteraceae bacterium]
MGNDVGRRVLGAAAFAFGVIGLVRHDFDTWQQLRSLWQTPLGAGLACVATIAEIAGGAAIQWNRSARPAALALGIVYLFFALRWVPAILAHPGSYDGWGNVFEQLSLVCGALIVYACAPPVSASVPRLAQAGRYLFGVCVISFTLEQLVYLDATASFVPTWIPPGPMFWAVLTTVAMGLGALALLSGQLAVLASRLLTLMMVGFGLLIWLPRLLSNPQDSMNWGGNAQNLAITGASWIVSDFLARTAATVTPRSASMHDARAGQ